VITFLRMDNATVITLSLDASTLEKMLDFYADDLVQSDNPYVYFQARGEEVTVTAYNKEKDGLRKVVFQGRDALHESMIWGKPEEPVRAKPKPVKRQLTPTINVDQIGSDEVGTGDFFGPVIVVAAYVRKEDLPLLKSLGVTDSKLLTDEKILEIAPKLLGALDYSQLCLPNDKFNEVTKNGNNMNKIKAKMHNRCLLNVKARHPEAKAFQDQFAEAPLYFSYLRGEKEVLRDIVFATKGETKFPSVAAASVIARYSFLRNMQEMNNAYGVEFPFGAGPNVERFAKAFLKKYGLEEMNKVAKANFATMKKILKAQGLD